MGRTIFRKTGLTLCMLLAFSSAPIMTSWAEEGGSGVDPTTINTRPPTLEEFNLNPSTALSGNIGNNISSLLGSGANVNSLSSVLSTGTSSGLNTSQWTSTLSNFSSNGASSSSISSLINGMNSGSLSPSLVQGLSSIGNLGNISSLSDITRLFNSSAVTNALKGLTGVQAGYAVDNILASALTKGSLSSLASGSNLSALTSAVANASPELLNLFGGDTNRLASALGTTLETMDVLSTGDATSSLSSSLTTSSLGEGGMGGAATAATVSVPPCCHQCAEDIPKHHQTIRSETSKADLSIRNQITLEFQQQVSWIETTFWRDNVLKALMMMANQLTTTGMLQVEIIGSFLDAKHQLETQRLFQQMTAKAHKDYQPSEGMCTFGTTVRSLASSERKSNLAQEVFAQRMMQRQTRNGDVLSLEGQDSDIRSRLKTYISNYCDQADNANGMGALCKTAVPSPERRNMDIDYTRNIESRLTLDADFTPTTGNTLTPDEQDVFALSANLFSHNIAPPIEKELLGVKKDGRIRQSAAEKYMDLRSVFAKRSVAQNSFAAITAMRAAGSPESAPYTKAIMRELGVSDDTEINKLLGDNPSYFAQMEVLTKKLYQNPIFYTELYDKPVNIERKGAALQAIGLMQDRDLYNSLLRSEAVLSVLLETSLQDEQEAAVNAIGDMNPAGSGK